MASFVDDPHYWCGRAEQVRSQAKDIVDPDSRRELLQIAVSYERIAQHVQARGVKRGEALAAAG